MKKLTLVVNDNAPKFLHNEKSLIVFEPNFEDESIYTTDEFGGNFIKTGISLTSETPIVLQVKYEKSHNESRYDETPMDIMSYQIGETPNELYLPINDGLIITDRENVEFCKLTIITDDVEIECAEYHKLSIVRRLEDFESYKIELLDQTNTEIEMAKSLVEHGDDAKTFYEEMIVFKKHVEDSKNFEELASNKDTLVINIDGTWYNCVVYELDGIYLNGDFSSNDLLEQYQCDLVYSNECDPENIVELFQFLVENKDILKFVKKNDYYLENENGLV